MVTTFRPYIGAESYVGYALENQATPGVPVAATDYVEVEPDGLTAKYNPKRENFKTAGGTLVVNRHLVEKNGDVQVTLKFPLFTVQGQKLIAYSGLDATGGLGRPQYVTLEFFRGGKSRQFAGCLAKTCKIVLSSQNGCTVEIQYEGLVKPALIAPSVDVATTNVPFPASDVYVWPDVAAAHLIAGGAFAYTDVDDMEVSWMFANKPFYGSNRQTMPTFLIPGPADCKGKFVKLHTSDDEYLSFLSAHQAPGPILFTVGPNISGHQVTISMPNAFYPDSELKGGIDAPVVEDYTFDTTAVGFSGNYVTYTAT